MNWDAVGSIAELVGAFAVLLTLIYLATQMKQNNKQMQDDATEALITQFNNFRLALLADGEVARIYIKGAEANEELSPEESLRFRTAVGNVMSTMWGMHSRIQNGTVNLDLDYLEGLLSNMAASPGIVASWKEQRNTFPAEFREFADRHLT